MKTTTGPSRRTALRALLLAPVVSLSFGSRKMDASRSASRRRHLDPGAWRVHYSTTGEALHIFLDGVDVTRDSYEAQEGDDVKAFADVPAAAGPSALDLETILGRGWVRRHVRTADGQHTGLNEILFGRVEFLPGGPLNP